MSSIIFDVIKIKYNAIRLAPAIVSFYEECKVERDNFLLLYLIFPIILNSDWINGSPQVKISSRLEKWTLENKLHLEGLPERVSTFRILAETSFQYCVDMNYLTLDSNNNVIVKHNPCGKKRDLFCTSAARLSKLFKSATVLRVYSLLGIRELI